MLENLPPVGRQERHPEQIYSAIIDWLIESKAQPGERLPSEAELSRHFGVSRTTMREAIRILEHSGLVSVRRGRFGGMFVGSGAVPQVVAAIRTLILFDQTTPESLFDAREVIESEIARRAAERITDEQLATLESTMTSMREDLSADAVVDANARFHLTIADACGNGILQAMMTAIINLLKEIALHHSGDQETVGLKLDGHQAVLNALRNRDPDAAASAMRDHVKSMYAHASRRRALRNQNGDEPRQSEYSIANSAVISADDD